MSRMWRPVGGVVLTAGLLTTACGGGGGAADASAARGGSGGSPVSVENCDGEKVTFEAPPGKIVTSNAAGLEILLRLGAGPKVTGTGFPPAKGALPAELADRAAEVPVLGRTVIPKEKLLGSGADAYIETFRPARGAHVGPRPEEFEAAGIRVVQLRSTACAAELPGPRKDLSAVTEDIERLGTLTGTSERAREIVSGMKETLDTVSERVGAVPEGQRPTYFVFDFDAGTKELTAVCGKQVANAVITLAGARNIFRDCDADYEKTGWEDVVDKNPDWIQLAVRNRGSEKADDKAFDEAERFLKSFPATRGLTAVKNNRFLRIRSERTTTPGVTNAETVEQIARTLYPDKFEDVR
ncbi:ABC transporter substrate-binding protein [Streptomyces toyocaensis]|uniref:ABC transporter substrate-binding protein n=1 Tax=Streptomyces toyocaensis TaxID=55952 RepID=A0A081XJ37_STRTO|nr:ABC transporter substrate-binding protein [Streptomyces toyocaensis]KES03560.1 ABC transporter substrate-binding protein [Streptomyces toyocaensis]